MRTCCIRWFGAWLPCVLILTSVKISDRLAAYPYSCHCYSKFIYTPVLCEYFVSVEEIWFLFKYVTKYHSRSSVCFEDGHKQGWYQVQSWTVPGSKPGPDIQSSSSNWAQIYGIELGPIDPSFSIMLLDMSLVVRKPVFGVSDQVPHKRSCKATQDG